MKSKTLKTLAAIAALAAPLGAAAEAPRFSVPLDCDFETTCYVQNYVDLDPGPGFADPTCGPLGYDGDRGTDLAVPTLAELRAGIPVIAAADGVVRAVRDGEPDNLDMEVDREAIRGREAGNAVVLTHPGGWETQYSHMRQGSVAVRPGQRVARGERLGLLGISGFAEFPHLEFAVRREGTAIDPFTGRAIGGGCGPAPSGLWTDQAAARLPYEAGGLLDVGFAAERPARRPALQGAYQRLGGDPPVLVAWAAAWGLRGGDRERLRLSGPDGRILAEREETIPGDKARWFAFAGLRRPDGGWPAGTYRLDYRVERDGGVLIDTSESVALD